jgi:hypothetical protein
MLASRHSSLNESHLIRLMKAELPKLYVILHHPPPPPLTNADIRIGVAELFRASDGREILRINGEHPRLPEDVLGVCQRDVMVKRMLHLKPREGAILDASNSWEIELNGGIASWTVKRSAGKILLVVPTSVVVPVDAGLLALIRYEDGRLALTSHGG